MTAIKPPARCGWVPADDTLYIDYHDREWGVPVYDDQVLFEFLLLEGAQAGLSWSTVLRKREHYRKVFDNFNPEIIAGYGKRKCNALLKDPGIIRNRLKISAALDNARAFLDVYEEYPSFSDYIWGFVDHVPRQNRWKNLRSVPASTVESEAMSKALKKRGFRFVGPTICYAFMQAVGMVNDHELTCYRHRQVAALAR